jgi:hypothetical protein
MTSVAPTATLWPRVKGLFLPSSSTLLSPLADIFMAGGFAIIAFFVCNFLVKDMAPFNTWAIAIYYAAFLMNYPHFTSSYQLLYRDGRKGFFSFTEDRFLAVKLWWAGLIVPVILVCFFLFALVSESAHLMGYLANAMYFFVGWHYVKQIYGCMIVLSSAKKVYYTALERWSILITLYAVWAVSYIASNLGSGTNYYYQIPYTLLGIPKIYLTIALGVLAIAGATMLISLLWKFYRTRQHPPLSALVAFTSIFLWFMPFYLWFQGFSSQYFFYMIPFFHSMQYMLFVLAYKRNWATSDAPLPEGTARLEGENGVTMRRMTLFGLSLFVLIPSLLITFIMYMKYTDTFETLFSTWFSSLSNIPMNYWSNIVLFFCVVALLLTIGWKWAKKNAFGKFTFFFVNAYLLGFFLFAFIPNILDILARNDLLPSFFSYNTAIFGSSLYLFFMLIAINVHHYFIDNVIWRRDNPHIRAFLFTH